MTFSEKILTFLDLLGHQESSCRCLSLLTNLSVLSVNYTPYNNGIVPPNRSLPDFLSIFSDLSELSLRSVDPIPSVDLIAKYSHLSVLHLPQCGITNSQLFPILIAQPAITSLNLEQTNVTSDNDSSYQTENLTEEDKSPGNILPTIVENLPYLRHLNLRTKTWNFDEKDLQLLSSPKSPQLLSFTCRVAPKAIEEITKFPELRYLDLSFTRVDLENIFPHVAKLTTLDTLILFGLPTEAKSLSLTPLQTLTKLRTLDVVGQADQPVCIASPTLKFIPSLVAFACSEFYLYDGFLDDLKNHPKLKYLKIASRMRGVDFRGLTNLSGLYTSRWTYYNHKEKSWKTNPHNIQADEFPIH